jgi:hypothetical protein
MRIWWNSLRLFICLSQQQNNATGYGGHTEQVEPEADMRACTDGGRVRAGACTTNSCLYLTVQARKYQNLN